MKEFFLICFCVILLSFYDVQVKADNLSVIDGDTITVYGEKIRFSGIDAPELKQICNSNGNLIYCGVLAKEVLLKRIGNQIPTCIKEGKDLYNRFLAECFVNGKSLSRFSILG